MYTCPLLGFLVYPNFLHPPAGMALFPVITARDYSVRQGLYSLEQESLTVPRFEFQFTSNFDFYPLGKQDFVYLDPPYHQFATIRPDLASCLWETLKMKVHFILCAARNGNCDAATNLLYHLHFEREALGTQPVASPIPAGSPAHLQSFPVTWTSHRRRNLGFLLADDLLNAHGLDCQGSGELCLGI